MIWIIVIIIIINLSLFFINKKIFKKDISNFINNRNILDIKYNLYSDDLSHKCKFIKRNLDSPISILFLGIIYFIYFVLINPILKLIQTIFIRNLKYRKCYNKNNKNKKENKLTIKSEKKINCYNISLDILILVLFILEIIIYTLNLKSAEISFFRINNLETILVCYFFYRLLAIFFLRSYEILRFEDSTSKYESYPRTFIIFLINFVEVIIAYSFLYSNSYFKVVFEERNIYTFLNTFNIFTIISKEVFERLCLPQQLLVLSHFLFYFIILTYFFNNLRGLKFKK